ncbi:membrane protein [Streptomyces olivochromogenes]|uniref:Membrane protein n=2 Tax=Streptomyces olivochromogenes TaxID=1963 RepID=A0A250VGS5_STROL|nr:membrane protein [Streptomyces olivochromogenes]
MIGIARRPPGVPFTSSFTPIQGFVMPKTALGAVGPAALTLLLGLWGIRRENSMWRDEAATWQVAHRTLPEIWHLLDQVDVVHGLYYLFMHGVFAVFGDSLLALRLPSVLAMSGAAALVTLLGDRLADRCTGLAAGLAFALIPAVQQYAQEGRPYALVAACVALACRLLVAAVDSPDAGHWVAYGMAVLTGALLNWFSLLVLFAHAVTIALARLPLAIVLRWAAVSSAAAIGALPLVIASKAQSGQVAWIPPVNQSKLLGLLLTLLAGALCAWFARPRGRHRTPSGARLPLTAVALPLLALPPLVLLVVSLAHPVYLTRYVLFGHLGLALLIGAACRALAFRLRTPPRRLIVVVMALAFLGLLPVELSLRSAAGRVDDVLSTAENVAAVREAGDVVLYIPAARRDTALVSPAEFTGIRDLALVRDPLESGTLNGVEGTPEQITNAMLAVRRIVVVSDENASATTERDRAKRRVLQAHFVRCSETDERGRRVTVYERRPSPIRRVRRIGERVPGRAAARICEPVPFTPHHPSNTTK